MNRKIFPVVLCGGVGKRLWPVSRQSHPKQFSNFLESQSLFQNTVERFNDPEFESPLIVTNNDYRFIIEDQLNDVSIEHNGIIIEPFSRDTAPAILASSILLNKTSDNPILLILPSDHIFDNQVELKSLIFHSTPLTDSGEIITFGIKPDRVETGYGWIEFVEEKLEYDHIRRVRKFHEKPEKELTEYYYKRGNYLWNSGIYLFSAETIIDSFKKYSSELFNLVNVSVEKSRKDLSFTRLHEASWDKIKPISIDYAIMEKSSNLLVTQYEFGWDDLGDWNAVWRKNKKDENGVVSCGPVFSINCKDSYLRSENPNQQLVALGCEDMVVISMPDAVLVSKKNQVQYVKDAINKLQIAGQYQSWQYPIESRNWGKVETIFSEGNVQINRLIIQPGKNIILQRHSLRAEHWVILEGIAQITLDNKQITLMENQSLNIPIGTKHSLRNTTQQLLIVMEIQAGLRLDMEDVERFVDIEKIID